MPSKFTVHANRMDDACDVVFGESWGLQPMTAGPGGGLPSPDPARQTLSVTGIYEGEPERSTEFGSEARGSIPRSINKPTVSADIRQFTIGQLPRRGDRLTRDDGSVWEISDAPVDSEGRLKFSVKQVGDV